MEYLIMIICTVCKAEFPLTSDMDHFHAPIIHEADNIHKFIYKDRQIFLERFYKIIIEEEISSEESGELQAQINPSNVPCYYCGKIKLPCECGYCKVVVCLDCWDDHEKLLTEITHE